MIAKSTISTSIADSCERQTGIFYELDKIYQDGSNLLCTDACPCTGEVGVTNQYGASTLLGCPGSDVIYPASLQEEYGKYLRLLEEQFQCSGMCTPIDYYIFTGTGKGVPLMDCQEAITAEVETEAGLYAGWSILFSVVGMIGLITAVTISYVERRKFVPEKFSKYHDWGLHE